MAMLFHNTPQQQQRSRATQLLADELRLTRESRERERMKKRSPAATSLISAKSPEMACMLIKATQHVSELELLESEVGKFWLRLVHAKTIDLASIISQRLYDVAKQDTTLMSVIPATTTNIINTLRTGSLASRDIHNLMGGLSPNMCVPHDAAEAILEQENTEVWVSIQAGVSAPTVAETQRLVRKRPHMPTTLPAHLAQLNAFVVLTDAALGPKLPVQIELRSFLRDYSNYMRIAEAAQGGETLALYLPLLANKVRLIHTSSLTHQMSPNSADPRMETFSNLLLIARDMNWRQLTPILARYTVPLPPVRPHELQPRQPNL
jgi:hypothetical protein